MPTREKLWCTTRVPSKEMEAAAVAAEEVSRRAYAPYSKFRVGAAVVAEKPFPAAAAGVVERAIFAGCNTENANYTLTLHAEHSAIAKAVEAGYTSILAVVIFTPTNEHKTAPCGSCRQVIYEFGPDATVIATSNGAGLSPRWHISELLPNAFGPANLEK